MWQNSHLRHFLSEIDHNCTNLEPGTASRPRLSSVDLSYSRGMDEHELAALHHINWVLALFVNSIRFFRQLGSISKRQQLRGKEQPDA